MGAAGSATSGLGLAGARGELFTGGGSLGRSNVNRATVTSRAATTPSVQGTQLGRCFGGIALGDGAGTAIGGGAAMARARGGAGCGLSAACEDVPAPSCKGADPISAIADRMSALSRSIFSAAYSRT